MNRITDKNKTLIRIVSMCTAICSMAACSVMEKAFSPETASFVLAGCGSLLFVRPGKWLSWKKVNGAVLTLLLSVPLLAALCSLGIVGERLKTPLCLVSCMLPLLYLMVCRTMGMLEDGGSGYARSGYREVAEDLFDQAAMSLWLGLSAFSCSLSSCHGQRWAAWLALILQILAYGIFYMRNLTEDRNRSFARESSDSLLLSSDRDAAMGSDVLFDRIVAYMEEEEPYLSALFSLDDMAKAVRSNSGYVSKAINGNSGMNFSQFVNRYRVNYAMEQFKKNPQLRVLELGQLSGFNSKVTFNMAFKLVMSVTPGEWCRSYLESRPHYEFPSTKKEHRNSGQ